MTTNILSLLLTAFALPGAVAFAASDECQHQLEHQFIRTHQETAVISNWKSLDGGQFTADLQPVAANPESISGRCFTDADHHIAVEFFRPSLQQKYQGKLSQSCGTLAFDGTATQGENSFQWFSVPALSEAAPVACSNYLPATPDGRPLANDCAPKLNTAAEVSRAQCLLRRYIWGTQAYPLSLKPQAKVDKVKSPFPVKEIQSVERWTLAMPFSFASSFYFYKAAHPAHKLALFQQGHRDTMDDSGGDDTIQTLLHNGYDVVALYMPLMGDNKKLGPAGVTSHDQIFSFMKSNKSPEYYDPLRIFLEPVIAGLNEALSRGSYTEVLMTGVSGGGWTTTWIAALDLRITVAIPVAGSLPINIRQQRDIGDMEQYNLETYQFVGYNDLYLIGAWQKKYLQVSNKYDGCCFALSAPPAYVPGLQAALKSIGGQYNFAIDSSFHGHMISPWALRQLYTPLLGLK